MKFLNKLLTTLGLAVSFQVAFLGSITALGGAVAVAGVST